MKTLCQPVDGKCSQCGYPLAAGVHRQCSAKNPRVARPILRNPELKLPSLPKRAKMVCAAVGRWVKAGRPVRSAAEIESLLAICQACELFTGTHCSKCGCPINNEPAALHNKLAMATEKCPLSPPKWGGDVPG